MLVLNLAHLRLDLVLQLTKDHIFVVLVLLRRRFEIDDLLFVLVFLVLECLNVLVTFLHLILAVIDFLLKFVVVLFERLHIIC